MFGAKIGTRGGVEDTRLEAKAKDTKKIRGEGQGQPFPRTDLLEAKAKDTGASVLQKNGLQKFFSDDLQNKRSSKNVSGDLQNFNNSKSSAILEPRTGQFSRT